MSKTLNIPSTGEHETAHTVIGDLILFVTIDHDQDCPNPLEDCDGMGHIYSGNRRHLNHKDYEELREILQENPDAVMLSYYEHGLCKWDVAPANHPDPDWDSVAFAGVWVPDESLLENCAPQYENLPEGKPERAAKMREWAQQACDEYSKWCNGECFCYSVNLYAVKREGGGIYDQLSDYRYTEAVADDSLCGLIGSEYAERSAKEAAEAIAKEHCPEFAA